MVRGISAVLEYAGQIEDGLPEMEVTAYAVLAGGDQAGVIYVPSLTIAHADENGAMIDSNMLLTRLRELGWATMSKASDTSAPCPGWDAALKGERFTVRQPDGAHWYDGLLPTSPAWQAAVQHTRQLDHYTADHNALDPIIEAVYARRALTIRSTVR